MADDHAGHIFADIFGGSPELDNLVSQAKDVNLKAYRRIERNWEEALASVPPKKVQVEVKINYGTSTKRPTSIKVTYNTVVSNTDDFGRTIRNQIDNVFIGKTQMEFAFTGVPSGYFDDLDRSSDDFVEFANHAKNGTDDLAKIFSSQADEMSEELSEQGLKIGNNLKQAGKSPTNIQQSIDILLKLEYYNHSKQYLLSI